MNDIRVILTIHFGQIVSLPGEVLQVVTYDREIKEAQSTK